MGSIKICFAAALLTFLAGCATSGGQRTDLIQSDEEVQVESASVANQGTENQAELPDEPVNADAAIPVAAVNASAPKTEPAPKIKVESGTGRFFNHEAASRERPAGQSGDVTFNFENSPIQAVIKAILGELLQENYVIAPGVQGNVTFSTAKPINASQARAVLETLLSWNNLAMVLKDGRYTVLPVGQAIPGNLTPRMGLATSARGYEVRVVPLQFIAPTEAEKLLAPYVKQGAIVRSDNARSMIVLAGNSSELQNYLDTLEIFDVDWLAGMSIGLYPLERVEVSKVAPELEKIFGEGGATPLAGMFRFLPIERMNAMLVITPQPKYLETAEQWLGRLDRGGNDSGVQLYVYYVKNVKATDLATNLTDIFSGSGSRSSASSASQPPIGSVVPGIESVEIRSNNNQKPAPPKASPQSNVSSSSGGGGISIREGSDVRISAIEESNALLIRASSVEYDSIMAAIKRLDIVPLQVLIEAKILQVDLSGSLNFGVKWFFENSSNGAAETQYRNRRIASGGRNAWNSFAGTVGGVDSSGGGGLAWTFLNTSAEAIVSTLQSESVVRVLSAPSLLVLNNKEASINVGTQIPVVSSFINPSSTGIISGTDTGTGTTTGTSFGALNQSYVQFRDTGIILNVTPRVNPGGLVFLELKQEKSTPGASKDAVAGNVPVNKSVIETEIAVQSGQTIMLGGLISEDVTEGKSGLPGLMKIPLIGGLFGRTGNDSARKELLVLVTPTVVGSADEAQSVTDEYRKRFKGIKPLLEKAERESPPIRTIPSTSTTSEN
jgi:general secretion pathway protein D